MPMVTAVTNLPSSSIPSDLEIDITEIIAKCLNKPKERIAVEIRAGARLIHGGEIDPALIMQIRSIGSMSPEQNNNTTIQLTKMLTHYTDLTADKIIIEFYDLNPNNVGYNGTTVAMK